jgi:hypothetical protein
MNTDLGVHDLIQRILHLLQINGHAASGIGVGDRHKLTGVTAAAATAAVGSRLGGWHGRGTGCHQQRKNKQQVGAYSQQALFSHKLPPKLVMGGWKNTLGLQEFRELTGKSSGKMVRKPLSSS